MDRQTLIDQVRGAVQAGPPLRLAILFGSGARDALRPDSDLDVGIVPEDNELSLRAELDLQATIERAVGRTVDLVRLDRASTLLRWEAARDAVPVLACPQGEFARFRAEAAIEHADILPNLQAAQRRLRARLLDEEQPS